jgi:hypothetical protein
MTPEPPIFVFGSNLAGRHGKGAALWALHHRGAITGRGEGRQGDSYAIPTKGVFPDGKLYILPLATIRVGVNRFLTYAGNNPNLFFTLTPIGCGLAGYQPEQIAPMFAEAPDNVIMPVEFEAVFHAQGLRRLPS